MKDFFFKIDDRTGYWLIAICMLFLISLMYIIYVKRKGKLTEQHRFIELLPSLISTFGVLGTFWGITIGLQNFDTEHISEAIPDLLDGMRTAFFTSLAGMVCSMILSTLVNALFDKLEKGASDINIAAGQITQAVNQMCQTIVQNTQQQTTVQSAFYNTVNQTLVQMVQTQALLQNNTTQLLSLQSAINADTQNINGAVSRMLTLQTAEATDIQELVAEGKNTNDLLKTAKDNVSTITESTTETNRNVGEITSTVERLASVQNEISGEVKGFSDKLHGEVVEIEENMEKTNQLLEAKFDEFTELLKKSNTEALVEVMKKVTEEFNSQMSELINKLVQENFEQLNKSVEQLNTWQIENKEMIQSLTEQYKSMEKDFEATSTTLLNVGEDTKSLVSDGSQLRKIVAALNAVMVEDKRFIEMTSNLNAAAELTKTSMTEFKDAQTSLNDWVKKQRNFVDAVQALMKQLEEIAKINDYSKEFWKDTRSGMNDSLAIIQRGSQSLMQQIQNLDGHFYTRLNTTLANLDQCIQKMIDNV